MRSRRSTEGVRLTQQFRVASGMVYWLEAAHQKIQLTISPRRSTDQEGAWRIAAQVRSKDEEPVVVEEWGETRAEALEVIGRTWLTRELPLFDWEAVAGELNLVRAL
jgi:hypothetical protein